LVVSEVYKYLETRDGGLSPDEGWRQRFFGTAHFFGPLALGALALLLADEGRKIIMNRFLNRSSGRAALEAH
jgi:hypothetical protein